MTLIELHFLPSIEYFCALFPHEHIVIERHENFVKQSYRNRCYINAANHAERITLPVTAKSGKVLFTEVRLDPTLRWQSNFWRTLKSAYAKAPYFEHYADDLRSLIFSKHNFLYDLNLEILSMCLKWLHWKKKIAESAAYEKETSGQIHDLRNVISSKKDYRERNFYKPCQYYQVFGNTFAPNLSLIDLLFCEGPHSPGIVDNSRRIN